jgi:hypothetical protein
MQEAMLACIDVTKPTFDITLAKLATRKFPMIWLCEKANSVIGKKGELLEYPHLMARIPRCGQHGPTHMGTNLDTLRKECPAEQKEQT